MTFLVLFVLYAIALSVALARRGLRGQPRPPIRKPATRPSRVLIIGATGGTGRQLVTQALDRGYEVTALVRDPSKLRMQHARLRLIRGDVLDYSSVDAAVRGQDAVVSALGHKRYFYPTRILSDGTRNLLRSMETHGVSRLVCQTSLGIGDSAGRMGLYYTLFIIPVILPLYYWDKTRQERLIARSSADWVIVRPGLLNNGPRKGVYQHGSSIGSFVSTVRISRADAADFLLNQIESDAYIGAAPGVCW
jgi:putative NADH-flavin reductase